MVITKSAPSVNEVSDRDQIVVGKVTMKNRSDLIVAKPAVVAARQEVLI